VKNLNKTVKVAFVVAFIFALGSIGFANATPKPLKECNMVYWTSETDKAQPVPGNQVSGFKLTLDPSVEWYFLGFKFLKPLPPIGDPDKPGDIYPFHLIAPTPAENPGFWTYWNTKLSDPANAAWAPIMSKILAGKLPMFVLLVKKDGTYMLVDGLQLMIYSLFYPLRVNGDYPLGTYVFEGSVSLGGMDDLEGVTMTITFR